MVSVLMQERLLGAALGSVFAGAAIFEQRKSVYSLISENQSPSTAQLQVREPVSERKSRSQIAHVWNKAVDRTFIPVISFLSSRGW
ncbi:hypothetical protein Sjap_013869 [Stephania japonica]|uniref:Uncharacterized protein n=1 Tax=Stephania japonica TaxID=461633 RepID=A0AAP0NY35_9MAGN